jgi:hypothetical protein
MTGPGSTGIFRTINGDHIKLGNTTEKIDGKNSKYFFPPRVNINFVKNKRDGN